MTTGQWIAAAVIAAIMTWVFVIVRKYYLSVGATQLRATLNALGAALAVNWLFITLLVLSLI